jgi:hypothetical protein
MRPAVVVSVLAVACTTIMRTRIDKIVLAMAAVLLSAAPGAAQPADGTTVFARVAFWQIARTNWDAYEADLKKTAQPVLDKLMAEGVIVEYGFGRNTVHSADGFTHVTWYASPTIAGVEKALAAVVAADATQSAADRRRADTDFAGSKHADALVRSRVIRGKTTKLASGYMYLATDQVQPGKGQAYTERYDKVVKPLMESLVSSGAAISYGIDTEFIHTMDPAMRTRWIVFPEADGLDKMLAAGEARNQALSAAEREANATLSREVLVGASHRDELWKLTGYAAKY